jgi:hypothetical protein
MVCGEIPRESLYFVDPIKTTLHYFSNKCEKHIKTRIFFIQNNGNISAAPIFYIELGILEGYN